MTLSDLHSSVLCGMLSDDRVIQSITMVKHEKVLELHPYKITPPATDGGRWQTYVIQGETRKIMRASSRELILAKLYEHYYTNEHIDNLTLEKLFPDWLSYKETITSSPNTIRRHEQHWKKYFLDSALVETRLSSFDKLDLQMACNALIKRHNLSSKEWQNIKVILSGMFEYAYDKSFIRSNYMKEVKITVKYRQVNKKTGKSQTYQTDEYGRFMEYLASEYQKTGDIAIMAVKLDFMLGLRVGELVALRWSDIKDFNRIHICREEVKESERDGESWKDAYKVVEHTKTHSDRILMLVPKAIAVLNEIKCKASFQFDDDNYIFIRNGARLTSRQINYVLEKGCTQLGIPVKSSHKIRKTVASRLSAGNVPLDAIREHFGHSNLTTTLGYIYNPLTEKETYTLLAKSL